MSDEDISNLESAYLSKPHIGITPPFRIPPPGSLHDRLTEEEDYSMNWSG